MPSCRLRLAVCCAAAIGWFAVSLPLVAAEPDFSAELPRIAPHEPAQALKTFQLLPGFRIEQAAAEPLVVDPVAMAFDERGRLYVVEMRDYSEQDKDFLGTVRLLEDTDGDGRFDKSTVFVDKLSWPTAIACWDGGVFIGAAPDIVYCKDTNGDAQADVRRVVYTGFGRTNVQGLTNTFLWGLDNRIHGATSSSGAEVRRPDDPNFKLSLRGRDFSFDPRTLEMLPESGGAQHGMSFDNWGRKFVCSNSDHLQLVMFEDRYLARNPLLAAPSPRLSIAADGPQAEVFRISEVEPWRIVRTRLRVSGQVKGPIEGGGRAAGYFTGATGATIYRGNAWPAEYVGQAFIGDVGSNIVHRKVISDDGIGMIARRVDEGKEFVASTDTWFRPAQFANAPDGTLYIADVYREVIEHPASLPPEIKKHLDLTSGRDRGRIYRIVPDGFKQPKLPRLDEASTAELVATLEHPNGWHRDTAARLLYQRQDMAAGRPLEKLVSSAKLPEARMHAMHVLAGMHRLTPKTLLDGLNDPYPRVREHAVRLAEPLMATAPELEARLFELAGDDDLRVRFQLAFTLGEMKDGSGSNALILLARRDGADRWMRLAMMSSLSKGAVDVFAELAADKETQRSDAGRAMLTALATQIGATGEPAQLSAAITMLVVLPPAQAGALLRTLSEGVGQRGTSLRDVLAGTVWLSETDRLLNALVNLARKSSLDDKAAMVERLDAIRSLGLAEFSDMRDTLAKLLDLRQPQEVQLAALATLTKFVRSPEVGPLVLTAWPSMSPRVRSQATEVLFARPERVAHLLDAIEKGAVSPTELEPARIKQLESHGNKELAERAKKLFAAVQLGRRQDVLAAYQPALQMPGDRERGKAVFKKVCAACHKLEEVGTEIGPNLATVQNRGAESILLNVLDPNREVNPQYVNYVLTTTDGRSLTGLIAAETATSVTLKRAEAQTDTVLRVQIEELQSTRLSIMPEGVEKQVDLQGMADLIAYLLAVGGKAELPQPAAKQDAERPQSRSQAVRGNEEGWKAGVATVNITPQEFMWMSGYGARDKPAEGKQTDLWAKALVLQDARGQRAVLVTLDLVGIDRETSLVVRNRLKEKHGLELSQVALNCSHTHCGPVVGRNLSAMYFLDERQQQQVTDYTLRLEDQLVEVVGQAIANLTPSQVSWGQGRATFAVNRRNNKEAEVPQIRTSGGELKGPLDHDVPVLKVTSPEGKLRTMVFGYACHATVLSYLQWCGDYPGFAQIELERSHPGAVAMFFAGCGADQNPLPRRTLELAQEYGQHLARSVEQVLAGEMTPIAGSLSTQYAEIELQLAPLPTREQLEEQAQDKNRYLARRAMLLLDRLAQQPLSPSYPYPVQSWRLGSDLLWITLGGEVVVDYSLRLKRELGAKTWVAGYTNDVMAYIPSRRVLEEGGYEGGGAMVYYGLPTVWAPEVEEAIVKEVMRQAQAAPSKP